MNEIQLGDAVFKNEPGWSGVFTRHQADGAIPNGTRIVKGESEPGDSTPSGSKGTVLGSIDTIPEVEAEARGRGVRPPDAYFYSVEWDRLPHVAVNVMDWKIARADGR